MLSKFPRSARIFNDTVAWVGQNHNMITATLHRVYINRPTLDGFLDNGFILHFLYDRSEATLFGRMELRMAAMVTKEWAPGIRGMTDITHLKSIWESEEKKYEAKFKDDFIRLACFIVSTVEIDTSIPAHNMIRFREDSPWYNIPFFLPMTTTVRSTILPTSDWKIDILEHSSLISMITGAHM